MTIASPKYTALFGLFVAIAGCSAIRSDRTDPCEQYKAKIGGDPVLAARHSYRTHDVDLLAVNGFTTDFPSVFDLGLVGATGYLVLEGTTDSPTSISCSRYQEEALRYARRFNQEMLRQTGKTRRP
jgi:hypothetical protein